jgi:hypothetical protein
VTVDAAESLHAAGCEDPGGREKSAASFELAGRSNGMTGTTGRHRLSKNFFNA